MWCGGGGGTSTPKSYWGACRPSGDYIGGKVVRGLYGGGGRLSEDYIGGKVVRRLYWRQGC